MAETPTLTQALSLRRTGPTFTETQHRILADGEPTGFTLTERTNGAPEYHYTSVEVRGNGEVLDLLADDGPDPTEWMLSRLATGGQP